MYSCLRLAPGGKDDGRLDAYELFDMELSASLITLSACRTGLGKITRGDEIIGLSRGFLYAGTPSVLASLWSVDDEATSDLMSTFYRNLIEGQDKVTALTNAEKETRKKYPHPNYWAAFYLIGDWK